MDQHRQLALDGIAIVVNPECPLKDITMDQLAKIFKGEASNWKEIGGEYGSLAGTGDGQIRNSIHDAAIAGYKGFATLEPHLRGGGPTGGVTGPDLFPVAVEAFRNILKECGGSEA